MLVWQINDLFVKIIQLYTFTDHELIMRGYYRNKEMFKTPVGTPHGCVLYYKHAKKPEDEDLSQMTLVKYPEVPAEYTEKNAKYTTKILEVIEKG